MIENLVMYAYGAAYSGSFGTLFQKWQDMGIISFLLPFLIIFCLVFITLKGLKLFKENNAITAIIALAVGLMAMSLDFVPVFFTAVFPRMGVGLVILLGAMILVGLFADFNNKVISWGFFGLAVIIALVTFLNTANDVGWNWGNAWGIMDSEMIISGIIFAAVIIVIIGIGAKSGTSEFNSTLVKPHT